MYSFALAYPYSYSRCAALVKRLARRKGPEIPEEELQSESPSHAPRSGEIIRAETLTKSVVKTSPITMFLACRLKRQAQDVLRQLFFDFFRVIFFFFEPNPYIF